MARGGDRAWWETWVTPASVVGVGGIAIAVFSCQLNHIEDRLSNVNDRLAGLDAKIDRRGEAIEARITKTNDRLDSGLQAQTEISAQLSKVESDVQFVRVGLDTMERRIEGSKNQSPEPKGEIIR